MTKVSKKKYIYYIVFLIILITAISFLVNKNNTNKKTPIKGTFVLK